MFAGQLTIPQNMQCMKQLGARLAASDSFLHQYTPAGEPIDSVIEDLTVHAGPHMSLELLDLPEAFHPYSEQ